MKKDLAKQIYKDSGWQIDKDTKTTDYKPAPYCIFGEENADKVPVGREDGLIEFKDYVGGGTSDYNELENKPTINEVELSGDKTTSDLQISYNDLLDKPVIPHNAITLYPDTTDPFTDYSDLSTHWMKCLVSSDLSTYTLFFKYEYEGRNFPIRVLTDWDLFNDNNINCVKITANENSTLTLNNVEGNNPDLKYSTNGVVWNDYTGQIAIKKGSSILLKGNNPTGWSAGRTVYSQFIITGNVSISGNVMGLLDNGTGTATEIPNDNCFMRLFLSSTGIISVSDNFLPATTLKNECYSYMFSGCINLRKAPNLPATTIKNSCYSYMFENCMSLVETPELLADTLEPYCCNRMFYNCIALTKAPTLLSTTLATACYKNMFENCKSLFSVKILYTGNFADTTDAFNSWLLNTPSYAIIYYNGSDTTTGASAIPSGWQKITF